MNMPIADINRRQTKSVTSAQVLPFAKMRRQTDASMLASELKSSLNKYDMLNQHFALQNGSHEDVKQYVVYFCHLMAFFADGSHCGLEQPKQFVALSGHKEAPESIVLKEGNVHIELVLKGHTSSDSLNEDATGIRIEFPTQETFTSTSGEDYLVE